MTSTGQINSIDILIGKSILSRSTANKLGQIHDLIVDPVKGELSGLAVQMPDASLRLVDYREIYSFGPDAVMINSDESAMPALDSPLKALPLAKNNLIGVKVITESGKLLGQIASVYIHLAETSLLVYEVRSSLLDKLLGHSLYFPASQGCALSEGDARLVVTDDTAEKADNTLDALEARLFGPPKEEDPLVIVRTRGHKHLNR
ncbi:MAG: PRC-barrel domain-containing protein, partial [Acidobacteria bacterium]|nr:PRC-barrel domain-containing protein [Acidobacteriota bacterium]